MAQRVVVDIVGDPVNGLLSESAFAPKPFSFGGEAACMAFAFAAAELGHDVELRGWIHEPTFRQFQTATSAAPRVDLPARRPDAADLVIVPEGWDDPLAYLQLSLSPARAAIYVLAPPGLFGWHFAGPWTRPDPLAVAIDQVARPEHFQGMRAFGFELLTHSEGIVRAAASAGVDCTYVGFGIPWQRPRPDERKSVDVLALMSNRWAPLAELVLERLEGLSVDAVPTVSNDEMLRRMARARVLVWPSRVEGHATIPVEARSVECVPVALSTNPFAASLDEDHGAVTVDTVEAIAPAVRQVLADESSWKRLAERGVAAAREVDDWGNYVDRVRRFLDAAPPPDPGRAGRAAAGEAARASIDRLRVRHQERLEERLAQVEVARQDLAAAAMTEQRLREEIDRLTGSGLARVGARARRLARGLRNARRR